VVVTRGPYLQLGTPTSMIVRFRTDVAALGRVRYGTSPAALTGVADGVATGTEHEIRLAGLQPATVYYYSVGTTTTTLASGSDYFFRTSPPANTPRPFRAWVIGDAGFGNSTQAAVRDAYANFAGSQYTDLWLMMGDNAYVNGTDSEYQRGVFDVYPRLLRQSPLWPTLGNHDTANNSNPLPGTVPYFNIFTLPAGGEAGGLPSGTENYWSFDYANVHFVCLDSMVSSRSTAGAMLTWLRADLAATTQRWVIAFWHHPPYSKGGTNSDIDPEPVDMRQSALPILETYGADLVLCGHSHSYQRSFLLDGHYGLSTTFTQAMKKDGGDGRVDGTGPYRKLTPGRAAHEGTVYAIVGSSGGLEGIQLSHPAMYTVLNQLGSMVLDVDGDRLDARFLRETGAIDDRFTIVKGSYNVPPFVSAGPDQTSPFGAAASLAGIVHDDGYPRPAALTTAWTQVGGTGTALFANPAAPSTTVTFSAPGAYGLRLTASDGGLTSSDEVTVNVVELPRLAVTPSNPGTGQPVTVSVFNGPAARTDWVGLFTPGAADRSYLDWKYLNGSRTAPASGLTEATFAFTMPAAAGTFELRFYASDAYTRLATSPPLIVTLVTSLAASPSTGVPGQPATVTVSGGPANRMDWVGLFAAGAADTAYLDWKYLNGFRTAPGAGLANATITFALPGTAGTYEFRLFDDNGFNRRATSPPVTVSGAQPVVAVNPTTVGPAQTVVVTVSGGPGNRGDWVGLYASGGTSYLDWKYLSNSRSYPASGLPAATLTFTMPPAPGTYTFRLYANDGFTLVATSPAVTVR